MFNFLPNLSLRLYVALVDLLFLSFSVREAGKAEFDCVFQFSDFQNHCI